MADQKDNKLTLVKLRFSMNPYENLAESKTKKPWKTAQDLSHLIHSFGKNKNITNFVKVWMLEDSIQKPTTVTCGPFQLYFCKNFFFPDKNSKLHSYKKLTNTALETLLNGLFTLNPENNEQTINEYIKQQQISNDLHRLPCANQQSWFI